MDEGVTVFRREDSSIAFTGRLKGKLYLVDFNKSKAMLETYLVAKSSMGWLWHRRLAHVGMRNLVKLLKDNHILGLTNIQFEKDRICSLPSWKASRCTSPTKEHHDYHTTVGVDSHGSLWTGRQHKHRG